MRISARAASGWIAGAAAVAAIGAFGAGTASAESCGVPHVNGFTFTSLTAHHISCHEAQGHAVHTLRHGAPSGWTCSHRIAGRSVSFSCHTTNGNGHSYHFGYHVH